MTSTTNADAVSDLALRLSRLLGGRIHRLQRLSGGASRETWSFDLERDGELQELILRRDPPFTNTGAGRSGGMPLEARLFAAASDANMPVPRVLASGDADPDGVETGFLVMTRVAGETIARKILRDEPYARARSVLVHDLGAAIAKLHAVPIDAIEGLEVSDRLERYREMLDALEYPSPTFELAYRWLKENTPKTPRQAVVHGDYRLGNVIVDANGLASVLDWELAHIGDPMEDLGWLCVRAWRFGGAGVVAGLGSLEELYAGYRSEGGVVDEQAVHWWIVAGTLIWGIMCALQASAHTSGVNRSVELAAIGRRVSEQEHDLLELLNAPRHDPAVVEAAKQALIVPLSPRDTDPEAVAASVKANVSDFGVPDAAGLLEAVREYIERDVFASTTGRVQFHSRVAANVLSTVGRELILGDAARTALARCHAEFGAQSERELASRIRDGEFDARRADVLRALRDVVTYRLAIANPKHFG